MIRHARFRIACGLIVATLWAAPALGVPEDYDESFQACRERDDRTECCKSTANDCAADCERLSESQSPSNKDEYLVACQTECATSEGDCTSPAE